MNHLPLALSMLWDLALV